MDVHRLTAGEGGPRAIDRCQFGGVGDRIASDHELRHRREPDPRRDPPVGLGPHLGTVEVVVGRHREERLVGADRRWWEGRRRRRLREYVLEFEEPEAGQPHEADTTVWTKEFGAVGEAIEPVDLDVVDQIGSGHLLLRGSGEEGRGG